jgi:2-oxoglutarate ferredoxin oxidoreductase subunit alpha
VVIRLAGESGEGVISSGDILTQAAARGGYWTQTFRTYPAEIKGGPCMYQVRMGDQKIYSHGKHVDLLVCFNQEAWDLHWDSLGPDGVILFDDTAVEIPADYLPRARCAWRSSPRRSAARFAPRTWWPSAPCPG